MRMLAASHRRSRAVRRAEQHAPVGLFGIVQHQPLGLRRDRGVDILGTRLEAVVLRTGDEHRLAARTASSSAHRRSTTGPGSPPRRPDLPSPCSALKIACLPPLETQISSSAKSSPLSRLNLRWIASFSASVPSCGGYFVSPRSAAWYAASIACGGLAKFGLADGQLDDVHARGAQLARPDRHLHAGGDLRPGRAVRTAECRASVQALAELLDARAGFAQLSVAVA